MNANLEYMGVDKLHALGCTGKGFNALVLEPESSHRSLVAKALHEAAPDCTIYTEYWGSSGDLSEMVRFCANNEIDIINISLATTRDIPEFEEALQKIVDSGVTVFVAGGNEGADGHKGLGHEVGIMVGAATLVDGKPRKDPHSAIDVEMDFMSLKPPGLQGTSFASPTLAGIMASIYSYLGKMDQTESYGVLEALAQDMNLPGVDSNTGHGIVVVDIEKLDEFKENNMKLTKFDDVAEGRWSEAAIALVSETGIMNGIADGMFAPRGEVTREQLAQVLANLYNAGVIDLKK